MAVVVTNLVCELQEAVKVRYLDGNLFSLDNQGNQINVEVLDGGEPASISGTVSANVIRSDGGTVAVPTGSTSDNVVSVILPQAAYAVPGVVSIVIKLTASGVVTTIAAIVANVYQSSTDTVVDPGTIIPSIQSLISAIEAAIASIPADYSSLWASLAPAFSSSANYAAGQYVTYNGGLYRFKTAHSGAWSSSDVVAVNIGSDLSDLKSAIAEYDNTKLFTWTNGKRINYSTGAQQNETGMAASGYVSVDGFEKLIITMVYRKASSSSASGLAFYSDQNYETRVDGVPNPYSPDLEHFDSKVMVLQIPKTAKYVKTTWYATTSEGYSTYPFFCYAEKNGYLYDLVSDINTRMNTTEDTVAGLQSIIGEATGISNLFSFTDGKRINYANGKQQDSSNTSASGYVSVDGFDKIQISMPYFKTSGSIVAGLAFYTEQDATTFIPGSGVVCPKNPDIAQPTYKLMMVDVPSSAKYMKTSWWATDYEYYSDMVFSCFGFTNGYLQTEIFDLTERVKDLENEGEDTKIEEYYVDEMNDTIQKAFTHSTAPALTFLLTTDQHRYSANADGVQNFEDMIKNMRYFAEKVKCDCIINLGDLTDGNQTQSITLSRSYDCTKLFNSIDVPYIFATGNHDANPYTTGSADKFSIQQEFSAYHTPIKGMRVYNSGSNGTDYYIDYDALNLRMIVLNSNNTKDNTVYAYGTTTATWLANVLNTDKTVICMMHQTPIVSQIYGGEQATARGDDIISELQTFVNNGGTLIMLSGHSHRDVAFISPWVSIMMDCQRFSDTEGSVITPEDENPTGITGFIDNIVKNGREEDTYTEDLWTVGIFKPDETELDLIRFGAGADRYFHYVPISPTTVTTKLSGTITWSSSDTSVATVSSGVITGVSSGKCAVIAKDENSNYECWIVSVS